MNWWRNLKGRIRLAEPLKDHTYFKIGGPAKFFIEPQDPNDLKLLLSLVKRYNFPIFVIGRGSNLLISDKGINGVVLRLNAPYFKKIAFPPLAESAIGVIGDNLSRQAIQIEGGIPPYCLNKGAGKVRFSVVSPSTSFRTNGERSRTIRKGSYTFLHHKKLSYRDNYLNVGSGVLLSRVVLFAQDYGLSGAEFLAGIPGTVGGALAMNAGIAQDNRSIAELVESVTVMDYRGNRKILNKKDIRFGYRTSSLSKYIILSALIKLNRKNKEQINDKIKAYLKYRKLTQDLSKPSAGCIFRNPTGNSAGRLIDLCGLKGKRIGGAGVSLKHANFILNLENAAARDVLQLTDLIKKEVRKKFNIDLKPEIKIWQ